MENLNYLPIIWVRVCFSNNDFLCTVPPAKLKVIPYFRKMFKVELSRDLHSPQIFPQVGGGRGTPIHKPLFRVWCFDYSHINRVSNSKIFEDIS